MATGYYYCFVILLLMGIGGVVSDPTGDEGMKKVGKSETKPGKLDQNPRNVTGKNKITGKRVKRYPEHLDPNYPLWVRIGECPSSLDGNKQHFCPTPTTAGRWVCVDDYQLCDGIKNCPNAEDESSNYCLFYKVLKSEVETLTRSISALRHAEAELDQRERDTLTFEIDDTTGESGQGTGEEAYVNRFHRQSGQFVPAH